MTFAITVTLETGAKVQYFCTLVRLEALRQFDLMSADVKNTDTFLTVDYPLKGLAWYFFPVKYISKQNHAMRRCILKKYRLKVRRYAA